MFLSFDPIMIQSFHPLIQLPLPWLSMNPPSVQFRCLPLWQSSQTFPPALTTTNVLPHPLNIPTHPPPTQSSCCITPPRPRSSTPRHAPPQHTTLSYTPLHAVVQPPRPRSPTRCYTSSCHTKLFYNCHAPQPPYPRLWTFLTILGPKTLYSRA